MKSNIKGFTLIEIIVVIVITGIIGSMAAACECEVDGNVPISPERIQEKIDTVEKLAMYSTK